MKKIIICLFIIIAIILVGILAKDITIEETNAENNNFVYIDMQNIGNLTVYRYYDKSTKVIYMYTRNNGNGGGLTVMVNEKGEPLLYQ